MKLHLSSYKIPDVGLLETLAAKAVEDIRLGFIVNASDSLSDQNQRIDRFDHELTEMGFRHSAHIDLREYSQESLKVTLGNFDVVHALGGNAFELREAMRRSGFDRMIKELLDKGLVYSGDSAGAIVMGPSLAGFQSTNEAGPDAPTDGLDIVDVVIVPHSDSKKAKYQNRWPIIQKANPGYKVLPLNDNQVYIVDGDSRQIVIV